MLPMIGSLYISPLKALMRHMTNAARIANAKMISKSIPRKAIAGNLIALPITARSTVRIHTTIYPTIVRLQAVAIGTHESVVVC